MFVLGFAGEANRILMGQQKKVFSGTCFTSRRGVPQFSNNRITMPAMVVRIVTGMPKRA